MTKILCQDLVDEFYQHEVRRAIRISTNTKFNRAENKNKGVAIAAPKKKVSK